jgi:acetyltransferase-like isoleucine patch superfamily enzyme/Flp pilus assembly pilin Flp
MRFLRDDQGVTAVVFALLLPVIVGGLALGIESGYWMYLKSTLQNAADVSAHSVGVNIRRKASIRHIEGAAKEIAENSGFHSKYGKLEVNIPPRFGRYKGDENHAEVVLTEYHERYFSSIFSNEKIEVGARAVVSVSGGDPLCYLSLSKNSNNAVQINALTTLVADGCGVASNSESSSSISGSFGLSGIDATCLQASGNISGFFFYDFEPCGSKLTHVAPISDPYLLFDPVDTNNLPCSSFPRGLNNANASVGPNYFIESTPVSKFCGDITISGRVAFSPGVYVFEGGTLNVLSGAVVTGSQISFLLKGGASIRVSGATLDLSAPTSGPHQGILFTNDRNDRVNNTIALANSSRLAGALYFPRSSLAIAGGRQSHCGHLIASTIRITGNTTFNTYCDAGQKTIMAGETVAVVE